MEQKGKKTAEDNNYLIFSVSHSFMFIVETLNLV